MHPPAIMIIPAHNKNNIFLKSINDLYLFLFVKSSKSDTVNIIYHRRGKFQFAIFFYLQQICKDDANGMLHPAFAVTAATRPLKCNKGGMISPAANLLGKLFSSHHCFDICLRISDPFDIKSFDQDLCNIGREKRRKRWSQSKIFKSKMQ